MAALKINKGCLQEMGTPFHEFIKENYCTMGGREVKTRKKRNARFKFASIVQCWIKNSENVRTYRRFCVYAKYPSFRYLLHEHQDTSLEVAEAFHFASDITW